VIACHLNVCILKFESSDDSRTLEGVTARIHGLRPWYCACSEYKLREEIFSPR
jgi:hypothetical protein